MSKNQIIKESVFVVFANAFAIAFGMLLNAILARTLTVGEFGEYSLMLTITALAGFACLPGMDAMMAKSIVLGKDGGVSGLFALCAKSAAIFSAVFALLLFFEVFDPAIFWFAIPAIGVALLQKYENILYAKRLFRQARSVMLGTAVCQCLAVGAVAVWTHDMFLIIASFTGIRALFYGYGLFLAFSHLARSTDEVDRSLKKQGLELTLMNVFIYFGNYFDRILLAGMSLEALAIYTIGSLIPLRCKDQLKNLMIVPMQTWLAEGELTFVTKLSKNVPQIAAATIALSLFLTLTAPWYIPLIFSDRYEAAVICTQILSFSIAPRIVSCALEEYNIYFSNGRFYQASVYLKQLFFLALLPLCIRYYGPVGAAGCILLMDTINCLAQIWYFAWRTKKIRVL